MKKKQKFTVNDIIVPEDQFGRESRIITKAFSSEEGEQRYMFKQLGIADSNGLVPEFQERSSEYCGDPELQGWIKKD